MKTTIAFAFTFLASFAQAAPDAKPTMQQVLEASGPGDWRALAPEDTLFLEMPPGRVVVGLAAAVAPQLSPATAEGAAAGGPVPAYLTNQISNYQAGRARLGG